MFLLKKRYWVIISLSLTVFFIFRLFPAHWLIYAIQQAVPSFQASSITGTLWQGRASYAQWVQRGHTLPLGELQWEINTLSILSLNPCIDFSSNTGVQQLKGGVCYSLFSGKISAREVDIAASMASIAPFFGVDLSGKVNAFIKSLELSHTGFKNVNANLLWEQASIFTGKQWLAAGNVQARLSDEDGNLNSQWQHVADDNPVPLEINVVAKLLDALAKKPVIKVNGSIKPSSPNSSFKPILQFIGKKNNDGSYRINFTE